MRVRERSGRPLAMHVGQWWARSGLVSGLRRTGPGAGHPGHVFVRRISWVGVPAGHGRVSGAGLAYRVQWCPTAPSCDTDAAVDQDPRQEPAPLSRHPRLAAPAQRGK
jgi:hypothetical protein